MTGHPCRIRCGTVVSISACHAEDPGSIPGSGALDVLRRVFSTAHVLMHGSVPCFGLTCHVPLLCTQARLLLQWQIIFKLCIKRFWLLFDMTGPAAAHPVSASDSCGVRTHALTGLAPEASALDHSAKLSLLFDIVRNASCPRVQCSVDAHSVCAQVKKRRTLLQINIC